MPPYLFIIATILASFQTGNNSKSFWPWARTVSLTRQDIYFTIYVGFGFYAAQTLIILTQSSLIGKLYV